MATTKKNVDEILAENVADLGLSESEDELDREDQRREHDLRKGDSLVRAMLPDRRVGNILNEVPLLASLTPEERAKLGGAMEEIEVEDGKDVFRQGDRGTKFYIISEGQAVVSKEELATTIQLATLNPGDYFGETALIKSAPRGATVTAKGALYLLSLDKDVFTKLFGEHRMDVNFAKRDAVSAEARVNRSVISGSIFHDSITPPPNAVREKDAKLMKKLKKYVGKTILFNDMDDAHKEEVIRSMYRVEIAKGTDVITQGELGSNLYVTEKGKFDIYVQKPGSKKPPKRVGSAAKCFGELALLYNAPRSATVRARKDSILWVVDRYTFRRIAKNVSRAKLRMYNDFLKRVPLLQPLAAYERSKLAEALEEQRFAPHSIVVKQGSKGNCMYIVKSGELLVSKHQEGVPVAARESVIVNRIPVGEYFGERAILKNEPRAATVRVGDKPVVLLKLDQDTFNLLLGPLTDIMQRRVEGYAAYPADKRKTGEVDLEARKKAKEEAAKLAELQKPQGMHDVQFKNLRVIGTLGKGSFGFVQLVKDKATNIKYALKAVSKQQVVDTQQQGHIMSEKRVMAAMKHPFLINLYATFKDRHYLYFLLEPSLGGELFVVLRNARTFDEQTSQYYAASVLLAFEYMHSRDTVYRDLKPENLLLTKEGYLKVTDFGFAKVLPNNKRTYTLCGTPEYLAPELVSGKGHGKGVDWWTLGILIFEMLAGYTPFYHKDHLKMYELIARGKYRCPSHFSSSARRLIGALLEHKPTRRAGVVRGGATLIKNAGWFAGFDFTALLNLRLPTPIKPRVKNDEDVSNFSDYADQKANAYEYKDTGDNWDADF